MSIIITHPTDQIKVKFGYCSRCFSYNEVWRKDNTTICNCGRKMYHINGWILYVLGITLFIWVLSLK